MENKDDFNELAYRKAKKRVSDIKNYYWIVIGYVIFATILLSRDYDNGTFHFSKDYINLMLILQGIFLMGLGIYLFVPAFHNWEERQIRKYMQKEEENSKKWK